MVLIAPVHDLCFGTTSVDGESEFVFYHTIRCMYLSIVCVLRTEFRLPWETCP